MGSTSRNLSFIPAERPFLHSVALYLLNQTQGQPEALTQYKILLPTRRTCRLLREIFLNLNNGQSILLPQMVPIGDVDEEDLSLMIFAHTNQFLDIPPAIAPMKRRILLAQLIKQMPEFAQGIEHALALASALAQFIDQIIVEGLNFSDLHKIVPDEFAAHWQITLRFLKIIGEGWPQILAEYNVVDVAQRRNMLLRSLCEYWRDHPPETHIIAAGSTGSIPAVGELLDTVSCLPNGHVILPGLDCHINDSAWHDITESHPQFYMRKLLHMMDVTRSDVLEIQSFDCDAYADQNGRAILASHVMLPAEETSQWKALIEKHDVEEMLHGVEYYSCKSSQEEASVIALIMREVLEEEKKVCALVTPDRNLAHRVSALCRRWGVEVDDSAGISLRDDRLGKFILLVLEALRDGYDAVSFLALLKTSLCRFSYEELVYKRSVFDLECRFLRRGYILSSYDALKAVIDHDNEVAGLSEFYERFMDAIKPLNFYASQKRAYPFEEVLRAHLKVLETLAANSSGDGADVLWRGDNGKAAAQFFTDLLQHASLIGDVCFDEYCEIFTALMRSITVRSAYGVHPRLLILGQLEARLSSVDLVIMGGLNEGVWPSDPGHDPWMSRPMRGDFGLPGTDQMVGIAAHDFVHGFCAPRIVMTRSEKLDAGPSVPARWLSRLETVMSGAGKKLSDLSIHPYKEWAAAIDESAVFEPYSRPEPRPPLIARPNSVSVTKVETWMKDPYAIYMHYVLSLRKMEPLVQDSDAALRGTILHEIFDRFTQMFPDFLPDDAEDKFLEISRNVLEEKIQNPQQLSYWWPRYLKIAAWFVAHERGWRKHAEFLESEIKGHIDLDIGGSVFTLYGMADRIDRMQDGYGIIDYKSGGSYSANKISAGQLPQLPLEALILEGGGFDGRGFKSILSDEENKCVPAGSCVYLGYWKITGGRQAGEIVSLSNNMDETLSIVEEGLRSLISVFRQVETPFYCIPDTSRTPRFNDYEHISRLKEWTALDADAEGGVV